MNKRMRIVSSQVENSRKKRTNVQKEARSSDTTYFLISVLIKHNSSWGHSNYMLRPQACGLVLIWTSVQKKFIALYLTEGKKWSSLMAWAALTQTDFPIVKTSLQYQSQIALTIRTYSSMLNPEEEVFQDLSSTVWKNNAVIVTNFVFSSKRESGSGQLWVIYTSLVGRMLLVTFVLIEIIWSWAPYLWK